MTSIVRQALNTLAGATTLGPLGSGAPRAGRRHFAVAATITCAALAVTAAPALAAYTFPFDAQLSPSSGAFGQLGANGVAVNDFNGDTYIADSSSGVIDVFNSSGTQLASLDGSSTPAGSFGGGQLSVDANNATGEVYVVDSTDNVIDAFNSDGSYRCQITGSATPSATECNGSAGSATPAGGFSTPSGITVDQATGDVYVLDQNNSAVDVFSAGGAYLREIDLTTVPGGVTSLATGIAVDDANGDTYVADSGPVLVYEFDGSGNYVSTWTGSNTPSGSFGGGYLSVATDDSSGRVYVTETADAVTDAFDASGNYLTQFSHSYNYPLGTAVDQASGKVYVSDNSPGVVDVFGPALVIPDVTTGSASNIEPTSATLNGTVNSDGIPVTDCHFDYGTDTSYGQTAACVPGAASIPADSNTHAVTANIMGLQPGVTYHFRLDASNANGTNYGSDVTFATPPPPSIDSATATNVTSNSAELNAEINPNGYDTTYHFEWGTSTSYGTEVPVPDADIGSSTSDVPVSNHLTGLTANTEYHWRVVATNANGTTTGADHTFVYDTAGGGLPDGRAYELVTPPDRNGALIRPGFPSEAPDIADDGSRVIDTTDQGFAGTGSGVGVRQNVGDPYAFTRTASGWVTTPLAPPATQFNTNTGWMVSADADTALFSMPTPPAGEDDFYAREADGSFTDIGPATYPGDGAQGPNGIPEAATADLSHVVYIDASTLEWPFDSTTGQDTLYEYIGSGNSQPTLVGVSGGSRSTALISTCGTEPGDTTNGIQDNALSANGSTVFFTALQCASGSGANASTPVPADELYARVDEDQTVAISEPSAATCSACDTSSPQNASFQGASSDGSIAFFETTQALLGSDTTNNLYEYDANAPAGKQVTEVSATSDPAGAQVQGVMAIPNDGTDVYYVAQGVTTTTPNTQGQTAQDGADNLYVYDAATGQTAFIAALPGADSANWSGVEPANVTPDGSFLVFTSYGDLTPDDSSTTGAEQVFEYDAQTAQLVRISIGNDGFNDNGNAGGPSLCAGQVPPCTDDATIVTGTRFYFRAGPPRTDPTMSDDGAYVFFESPVGLTPQALDDVQINTLNGSPVYAQNVYEYHDGHVYLISDGKDTGLFAGSSDVSLLGADDTGDNVFFTSSDQLVPQATDTSIDLYDARIGGGFPYTPPPAPCQGDACQGTPGAAPPVPIAATVTFSGPGNASPGAIARVRVLGRIVHGSTFVVIVKVPAKGRVTITGAGVKISRRSLARAGTYKPRVQLTRKESKALNHKRKLKLKLRAAYMPASGPASAARVSVTVEPTAHHKRRTAGRHSANHGGGIR